MTHVNVLKGNHNTHTHTHTYTHTHTLTLTQWEVVAQISNNVNFFVAKRQINGWRNWINCIKTKVSSTSTSENQDI